MNKKWDEGSILIKIISQSHSTPYEKVWTYLSSIDDIHFETIHSEIAQSQLITKIHNPSITTLQTLSLMDRTTDHFPYNRFHLFSDFFNFIHSINEYTPV